VAVQVVDTHMHDREDGVGRRMRERVGKKLHH
jgi:hypothetical protein